MDTPTTNGANRLVLTLLAILGAVLAVLGWYRYLGF